MHRFIHLGFDFNVAFTTCWIQPFSRLGEFAEPRLVLYHNKCAAITLHEGDWPMSLSKPLYLPELKYANRNANSARKHKRPTRVPQLPRCRADVNPLHPFYTVLIGEISQVCFLIGRYRCDEAAFGQRCNSLFLTATGMERRCGVRSPLQEKRCSQTICSQRSALHSRSTRNHTARVPVSAISAY